MPPDDDNKRTDASDVLIALFRNAWFWGAVIFFGVALTGFANADQLGQWLVEIVKAWRGTA
jgi:hypothetical protein